MTAKRSRVLKGIGILGIHLLALVLAAPSARTETLDSMLKSYDKFSVSKNLIKSANVNLISNAVPILISETDAATATRGLRAGDSTVIHYELSEAEGRSVRMFELKEQIIALRTEAEQELKLLAEAESPRNAGLIDFDAVVRHGDQAEFLELRANLLQMELDDIVSDARKPVVQRIAQIETSEGRVSDVEAFMKERMMASSKVISVHRIPRASVLKGRLLAGAGWMGLAAAVIMGSVTALEVAADSNSDENMNAKIFKPVMVKIDSAQKF